MQRNLRGGRIEISKTSQKVQSYLFIFFPSVDERLFSTIRPEMASPINARAYLRQIFFRFVITMPRWFVPALCPFKL